MQKRRSAGSVKAHEHSTWELYFHGLAAIIGLGILVLPLIVIGLYGVLSIYMVIAAGFIALLIGMLIYDISLKHKEDPYAFLRRTLGKEYSFIYGFLLIISFLVTTIAAGIASIYELIYFFNLSAISSLVIVDIIYLIMAILLFYKAERRSMNFIGALKIFFIVLLIIIGAIAVYGLGVHPYTFSINELTSSIFGTFGTFSFVMVLLLWMYGGFESIPIVYKGKDKTKVAKALMFSIFSAMILFLILQGLVYAVSGIQLPINFLSTQASNIFTANISELVFGTGLGAAIIIGLSIFVILTVAFAVINAGNKVLHDLSMDEIIPRFVMRSEGYKLLFTVLIPVIVITLLALLSLSGIQSMLFIGIIAVSAIVFVTAFFFMSAGYTVNAYKSKDALRFVSALIVSLILIALILTFPPAFLIGLVIILIITLAGYLLIK